MASGHLSGSAPRADTRDDEDWIGAGFEFHDIVLQTAFAAMCSAAAVFGFLVLERTFSMDSGPRVGTTHTYADRSHGIQDATAAGIRAIEASAAELCEVIDAFDRVAQDRMRIEAGAHADPASPAWIDEVATQHLVGLY